ncbi:MAG: GWxTD domain-containing protein [Candidatus Eisenbacteria bacterium]|uniref:GWxTD domain-containing protein n=1 Tax=Eiseniibacteriota bacterium TaxID=2212470 RepID=A0A538T5M4_UNCEI|nr:MAG: GWxTD domain-containing protein [Candidatus Eisenbacteria bacterium]
MRRHQNRAPHWLWVLVACALPGAPAGAIGRVSTPGEPGTSSGDLHYHASAVAYRHDAGNARVEFSIRVPYSEIRFLPSGEHFEARLRVTVELLGKKGRRAGYQQREARLQSTDAAATVDSLLGEIYTVGIVAPRAKYHYKITVEDMNVARRGLVYQMKNKKRQGEVQGDIDMSEWLFQDPALSGIEFAWAIQERTPETPFAKGSFEVLPHPSAYYGAYQDMLSAYYEIYDTPPPPEGRAYRVSTMIFSSAGDTLLESLDSLRVTEGAAWPHTLHADVASLPAGHYRLRIDLLHGEGRPIASSQGEFDMLWEADSWASDAADLYDVTAQTLLSQDEAYRFRQLSRGEKEARLADLWRAIDPTPDTAANELRSDFRRRLAYANAHYTVFEKGMFSDRGRIWIQFGEPDDIKIERLPVSDKTLGYVVDGQIPKASKDILTKPDQGVVDTRAFEIWTYNLRGHEMVPRHRMNEISAGMKFVFVDEQGYGDYTLRYSSVSGVR